MKEEAMMESGLASDDFKRFGIVDLAMGGVFEGMFEQEMLKAASKDSAEMDVSYEQGESDKATKKEKTGRVYDIDWERSTASIAAGQ